MNGSLLGKKNLFATVVPLSSILEKDRLLRNLIKERRFLRFSTYLNYHDRKIRKELDIKEALLKQIKKKNYASGVTKRIKKMFPERVCQCGGIFKKEKSDVVFLKTETFKDWEDNFYRKDDFFKCSCGKEKKISDYFFRSYDWHGAWVGHYNG